ASSSAANKSGGSRRTGHGASSSSVAGPGDTRRQRPDMGQSSCTCYRPADPKTHCCRRPTAGTLTAEPRAGPRRAARGAEFLVARASAPGAGSRCETLRRTVKGRRFLVNRFRGVKRPKMNFGPPQTAANSALVPRPGGFSRILRAPATGHLRRVEMPAPEGNKVASQPDWGLVTGDRLPDRGTRYVQTPPDPY